MLNRPGSVVNSFATQALKFLPNNQQQKNPENNMRIDRLELRNFKKFEKQIFEFPRSIESSESGSFHVLIGANGTGKTSILDALAIALGVWLEKVPDSLLANSHRRLKADQKRLIQVEGGDRIQPQQAADDMSIQANGSILGNDLTWSQELPVGKRNVSNVGSKEARKLIWNAYQNSQEKGNNVLLPVIAYYGAGRAWLPHNKRTEYKAKSNGKSNRWEAFYDCLNERIRMSDLGSWFRKEAVARTNRNGTYRPGFDAVLQAVLKVVPDSESIHYDDDFEEIMITIDGNTQPFSNLSAGQQSLFALVADIAVKMVTQNNFLVPADQLGDEDQPLARVLTRTPGVVLIDELDVHLHPKWQQSVVDSLCEAFPSIQFIVTTHSAFVIQSLDESQLINLEGQPVPNPGNLSVETIAKGLMGVERPDVGKRYRQAVEAAKHYLITLDEAAKAPDEMLDSYEKQLAEAIEPYADNPAFQAFLELKHAMKLGGRKTASEGND